MDHTKVEAGPVRFDSGPLADVKWNKDGFRARLVMAVKMKHPPEKIWPMLLEAEHLGRWAPYKPDRDLDTVGPVNFEMTNGRQAEVPDATVLQVVDQSVLDIDWNNDLIRWELMPDGEGTMLGLFHTVDSADWLAAIAAGWHLCLVNAERIVEGKEPFDFRGEKALCYGWQELRDGYESVLHARGEDGALDAAMRA